MIVLLVEMFETYVKLLLVCRRPASERGRDVDDSRNTLQSGGVVPMNEVINCYDLDLVVRRMQCIGFAQTRPLTSEQYCISGRNE